MIFKNFQAIKTGIRLRSVATGSQILKGLESHLVRSAFLFVYTEMTEMMMGFQSVVGS